MKSRGDIEPIYKIIGLRIKRLRESCGLSQRSLAESLSATMTSQQMSLIETGQTRIMLTQLIEIAEKLRTTPERLMRR